MGDDLTELPVFGPDHVLCGECGLEPQCIKGRTATAYRPKNFNGMLVIGEGPGQQEVANNRPFVGKSGRLLRAAMESVGIEMDDCYITNATLCKPPPKDDALHAAFPTAIPSCLGRLEAEIEAVRPRVIVVLGGAALIAVTGYDRTVTKREKFDCDNCNPNRRVGPVLQCSAPIADPATDGTTSTKCGHLHFLDATSKEDVKPEEVLALKKAGCTACGAKLKNVRPKMVKCPQCGGLKTRQVEFEIFEYPYNIGQVAGAIFEPQGDGDKQPHHIDSWYAKQGVSYMVPTYHPAFVLRDQQFMIKPVQKHLLKAKRLLTEDLDWPVDYQVTTDPAVIEKFVWGSWKWDDPDGAPNFAVDIETEAWGIDDDGKRVQLDARHVPNVTDIKVIGLARRGQALVVDTREVDADDENDPLLDVLYKFLTDDRIPKTYHNGCCYDVPVIDRIWGIPWEHQLTSYTDDTISVHHNLYPDEPHDLGHVTFSFTPARAWKPARTIHGVEVHDDFDELALYNARDVINTDGAREAMGADGGVAFAGGKLMRNKLAHVYEQDSRMLAVALTMTMHGMPLDHGKFVAAGETAQKNIDAAIERAREALATTRFDGPEEFNPFKVKNHLIPALYEEEGFNLATTRRTKTGPSTDETALRDQLASARNPKAVEFVQAVLDVREHNKIKSTYINSPKMQPWDDGRIHAMWKPWGARTGRFSSSPNLTNWPVWLRSIIVAPKGRKIVGSDFDQLELRGIAAVTGDPELTRRCLEADDSRKLEPDHDPHSYVAGLAFKGAYTDLSLKDPKHDHTNVKCKCETCRRKALRSLIKNVIYGLGYGAGDRKVLETIYARGTYHGPPITIEMVAHIRKTVFRAFSHVEAWRISAVEEAFKSEEIRSPLMGRRRIFPLGQIPVTEIYNFPIQSLGADIMNERTLIFMEKLPAVDPSAFLIAQVHDALYVECDEDKAEKVAKLLEETLTCEKTLYEGGPTMLFTAGAGISDNWKEAS